jgi:hypothetical protein
MKNYFEKSKTVKNFIALFDQRILPTIFLPTKTAAKKNRRKESKKNLEVMELALTSSPSYVSRFLTILSENNLISSENQY